jgi:hypothetical protein
MRDGALRRRRDFCRAEADLVNGAFPRFCEGIISTLPWLYMAESKGAFDLTREREEIRDHFS